MIGIICALKVEIEAFLNVLENKKEIKILNKLFYQGTISNKECILTICGIGKVQAALSTQLMVEHFKPDLVFNCGIAGGFQKDLKTLDTVFGEKIGCYDIDMVMDNLPYGCFSEETRFLHSEFKCPDGCLKGTIMTADKFAGNRKELEDIFDKHYKGIDITCVDMESYAVCTVLNEHNIPWVVIRTISDLVGENEQIKKYYEFPKLASEKSFQIIMNNYILK